MPNQNQFYSEVDLVKIWMAIWNGKWITLCIAIVFAIGAYILVASMPNIYRSEVLLASANMGVDGDLASVANRLGGIASLVGVDLTEGTSHKKTVAIATLKSRAFILNFIKEHNLEVPLLAAKSWDSERNEWIINDKVYDLEKGQWISSRLDRNKPSQTDLYSTFIEKVIDINEDKQTGLVTIGVELMSPIAAQNWLLWLVDDLNEYLRRKDIEDSKLSILYLEQQLSKTSVAHMQEIFYQLIEEQTKKVMLAEVRQDYAFNVIDPPILPDEKIRPRRMLLIALAIALGVGFGIVFSLIRANKETSSKCA